MKALKVHVLGMLGMVLLLAAIGVGADIYGLYSGITSQTIDVDMWNSSTGATCAVVIDPNDVDVYYIEQGKAEISFDPNECTSETAGWVSQTVLSHPSGASMRVDLPDAALDGGIHKWVKVRVKSTTYEGHAMIWLSAPMDAHLSGGSTPPTLANVLEGDFSSGTFPAMTLADDAITAAKYDESTAFPLAAASSSLATAAELAKVPKSDGSTSWNATALAAIANAILATALTEPTAGASPDLPTLDQAISWLYSRWFNKSITTGTEYQLFKRNESDKIYEQDYSDDGSNLTVGEAKAAD